MTRKKNKTPDIQGELIGQLLRESGSPQALFDKGGLFDQFKKRLIEKALEGELDEHLGYPKHTPIVPNSGNSRNGYGSKTIIVDNDQFTIRPPRDRNGSFEPQLIPKRQTRFKGFDDKILAMDARGMSVRDMQAMLLELYQVEVSEALISSVTDAVLDDVRAWQNRPLEALYPIVSFDCIVVKGRQDGRACNKAVYLALAITMDGHKELLGLWISQNEGAKFWLSVMTELKNRGAVVHGAHGAQLRQIRIVERSQRVLCRSENDLRLTNRRGRRSGIAPLGRQMGRQISLSQQALAAALGAHHPVFRLSARNPEGHLHDQRHRVAEPLAAQSAENQRLVSD